MIGRIAITLCVLTSAAAACPPRQQAADDATGVAIALAIMSASTLLFAIMRRNAVRRTYATSRRRHESSLCLAQSLARMQRLPAIIVALACLGVMSQVSLQWSAAPAVMFLISVVTLWRLQRVLGVDAATVTAHGEFLFIERDKALVAWIAAPERQVMRAAVPVARTL